MLLFFAFYIWLAAPVLGHSVTGIVTRVIDGDTVVMEMSGVGVRVRLLPGTIEAEGWPVEGLFEPEGPSVKT